MDHPLSPFCIPAQDALQQRNLPPALHAQLISYFKLRYRDPLALHDSDTRRLLGQLPLAYTADIAVATLRPLLQSLRWVINPVGRQTATPCSWRCTHVWEVLCACRMGASIAQMRGRKA